MTIDKQPPMNLYPGKLIWFKKAKCAGTSFESVLQKEGVIYYVQPDSTLEDLEHPDNRVICIREALFPYGGTPIKSRSGTYELKEKSLLEFRLRNFIGYPFEPRRFMLKTYPEFVRKYPKFAVVRNPYDKFISSWRYLQSTKNRSLNDVLDHLPKRRNFHDWIHMTQAQIECLQDKHGNVLVDQIIYMESNFEDDMRGIFNYLGLEAKKIPVKNSSDRVDYQSYLDPHTADRIFSIFQKDFSELGYSSDVTVTAPVLPFEGVKISHNIAYSKA